jgi:hypothetical protein
LIRRHELLVRQQSSIAYELERQKKANAKVVVENEERVEFCAVRDAESARNLKEVKKLKGLKEIVVQKIEVIEQEKLVSEAKKEDLEGQIAR